MNLVAIAKNYFCINVLLLGAYVLFFAVRRVTCLFKAKAGHRQLIQISQLLLFLSMITPGLIQLLPKETIPRIQLNIVSSLPERMSFLPERKEASPKKTHETSVTQALFPKSNLRSIPSDKIAFWFLLVSSMGFLFFALRLGWNARELHLILNSGILIRTLGRVKITVSSEIAIPFSARFGRTSWVVLPTTLLEKGNDLRIALRHELQHHRQNDTLWAVVIEVLICFFFPNPAIYLWKKEITELQEFSCDEALIGRKRVSSHEYGSCLVRVAETALGARNTYAGTTCMAAGPKNPDSFKSFLRRRIEMFTNHEKPRARRWAGVAIGTTVSALLMTLAFGTEQSLSGDTQSRVNPGKVVVDPEIQKIADGILSKAIRDKKAKSGFAIVADPKTGKILAVANVDTRQKRSEYWALSELFEPASAVKSLVVATALEKGLTTPEERHSGEGGNYRYGDRVYHDWKKGGWKSLSTTEAIARSSDISTIKIGERLGSQGIIEMLKSFGFGPEGSAKNFPQARSGDLLLPDEDAEHPRVIPYASMGAGFHITPLEMVQAYGALANGGNLMAPLPANAPDSEAQVVRRVLSADSAEKMRRMLEQVVLQGTATAGESKLYSLAGKTSTSHYPRRMPFDQNDGDFAGFIGFAPVSDPRVEVYVGIRDPESKDGAHGGLHASPVVREIAEAVLKLMKVAPDKI